MKSTKERLQKNMLKEKTMSFYCVAMGLFMVLVCMVIKAIKEVLKVDILGKKILEKCKLLKKHLKIQMTFGKVSGKYMKQVKEKKSVAMKLAGVMLLCSFIIITAPMQASFTDFVGNTVNIVMGDWTAPVITLSGDNPMVITVGNGYVEPGYTAIDDVNGDITADVIVSNYVDVNVVGTYAVEYKVSDVARKYYNCYKNSNGCKSFRTRRF